MTGPAFLTGGSGFVGGALLRGLIEEGREVRSLARSAEAAAAVRAGGGVPVRGDLFDDDVLVDGMRGCDTVFHVAGVNAMCLRDPDAMFRTNVDGSASVVAAAARADVARVVFTSSAATIGEARGVVGTEETPHRGTFLSAYERSKFLAERRVLELGADLGVDVVCVNPSSVQGPGRTEGSARLLIELVNARPPGRRGDVPVDRGRRRLHGGHLAAETRGRPGRAIPPERREPDHDAVPSRSCRRWRDARATWCASLAPLAPRGGRGGGLAARMMRRDLPFCSELARTLLHGHRYDGSRATRELGLVYRPIEETVARTLAWYAERGLIRRPGGVP